MKSISLWFVLLNALFCSSAMASSAWADQTQVLSSERQNDSQTATPSAGKDEEQNPVQARQQMLAKDTAIPDKSLVNDYIIAHGGCAALSRSWESEFQRPDRAAPYGKPFLNWDQDDFSILRKWVGRCLNPYVIQRGEQKEFLEIYDSQVRVYQREQEDARAQIRQQRQLAAEEQTRIEALIVQYDSARTQTQDAIRNFETKALPFLDQTRNLQLANVEPVLELGQEAASLGTKAQASVSQLSTASSNLERFAEAQMQPPVLDENHKSEVTSRQVKAAFDRVQQEAARVGTELQRVQRIQAQRQPCSQRLLDAGVPKDIVETKVFEAHGDDDDYLFQLTCLSKGGRVAYSGPSMFSKLFKFEFGNTPVQLWFDLRDDDGSKTWSKEAAGQPTPSSRLVLMRVKAGSTDLSADANWESVNLLESASMYLALAALQ